MINYVYCSTNPEQKAIAQGFCSYDFVNPVPIYDQYSTKDYAKKTLKELYGKTIVQWSPAIQDTVNEFYFDWWIPDNFLEHYKDKLSPSRKYYCISDYTKEKLLEEHNIHARVLLRCGDIQGIKRSFLEYKNLRIGIPSGHMRSVDLQKLQKELSASDLKTFNLYCLTQGEYRIHENQKTDSEIIKECPEITICDFEFDDMDIIYCCKENNEADINLALRKGCAIVSEDTPYAQTLLEKYSCIAIDNGNHSVALRTAVSTIVKSGRKQLQFLHKNENARNIFHQQKIDLSIPSTLKTINVFCTFRNNEDTIGNTLSKLKCAERYLGVSAKYYIYENDSIDDTPNQIVDFYKHSSGNYKCESLKAVEHLDTSSPRRLRDLAVYRNKMKELCTYFEKDSYTFIVDSEIDFDKDIMSKMISTLSAYPDAVMVTPYGVTNYSNEYYDLFAYTNMDGSKESPSIRGITEARSAFCGFACIRTDVFEKCHWGAMGDKSEHIYFCDMVREYGKIIVDSSIRVKWKKKINVTLSKAETKEYILIDGRCVENETRGIGRYAVDFINSLISLDVDYEIFVNEENELTKRLNTNRFTKITNLESQIDSRNADAYITISAFSPSSEPIDARNLKSNIKTYCIMHDIIPIRMNFIKDWGAEGVKEYFDKLDVIKNYTATLSNSEFTARDCMEYLPNIKHLGAGVNPNIKKLILPRPIREKYIFAQTAYDPHKGFDTLLQGYRNLDSQIKQNLKLVIGSDIELQEEGVYVTGRLSDEDLSNYHHHAWLFVCPSQYEGFGLPILEAWLHDNPVIAAKNSSLIEVIGNDEWLFNNDELTQKITKLYEDENYYNECKKYSARYKDFMWSEVAKKFIQLIQ